MLSQCKVEKCRETDAENDELIEGERLIKQKEEVQEIETRFFLLRLRLGNNSHNAAWVSQIHFSLVKSKHSLPHLNLAAKIV